LFVFSGREWGLQKIGGNILSEKKKLLWKKKKNGSFRGKLFFAWIEERSDVITWSKKDGNWEGNCVSLKGRNTMPSLALVKENC